MRPLVPLMPSWAKDAELVAFGVGQHDPGSIPLADIHPPCAMSDQPSHLGVLVIGPKVEVQSALGFLALIEPDEIQPRRAIRRRADLELVIRGVDDNPAQGVGPPLSQGHWIQRVDDHLFPFQRHRANLDLPGASGTETFHLEKRLVPDDATSPPMCDATRCTDLARIVTPGAAEIR